MMAVSGALCVVEAGSRLPRSATPQAYLETGQEGVEAGELGQLTWGAAGHRPVARSHMTVR